MKMPKGMKMPPGHMAKMEKAEEKAEKKKGKKK